MDDNKDLDVGSIINTFIKASTESAPQEPIYIEKLKIRILSQLHTMVSIPFGMGKSSKANTIPNSTITLDYTMPSIVGTINSDGELVDSYLAEAKKKVLVVDEAHRLTEKAVDAILNLLESGKYSRALGYKLKAPVKHGSIKSGYMMKSNKSLNGFSIYARFSCVCFSERLPKHFQGAFLSRFVPVLIRTDFEDAFRFLMGQHIYGGDIDFKVVKRKQETTIDNETYTNLIDRYKDMIVRRNITFPNDTHGYIVRTGMNLVKLSAHFARINNRSEVIRDDTKKALKYALPILRAIQYIKLTPTQITVLDMILHKMTVAEIASELDRSSSEISHIIQRLKQKKVIQNV